MTEDQIERLVERRMDAIDKRYLDTTRWNRMSFDEYDRLIAALNRWADAAYNKRPDVAALDRRLSQLLYGD